MKRPRFQTIVINILPSLLVLTVISLWGVDYNESLAEQDQYSANLPNVYHASAEEFSYETAEKRLSAIRREMMRPNILKEDVVRGYYVASSTERKYGTPNGWVFVEDAEDSRWINPYKLEEELLVEESEVCEDSSGEYHFSCLDTSMEGCDYVTESSCVCPESTGYKEGQGCIALSERGTFIAVTAADLNLGWYLGDITEKKLNTPSDWTWRGAGKFSVWEK